MTSAFISIVGNASVVIDSFYNFSCHFIELIRIRGGSCPEGK
jgi:hypothetical protein